MVCLDDRSIKGTHIKSQTGNSRSLSYKHWFNIYDYELHKSRNCDSITGRQYLFYRFCNHRLARGFEPTTLQLEVLQSNHSTTMT